MRVMVSGVNPTDWKVRKRAGRPKVEVPNQDGAGVVDAVGPGVSSVAVGDRVWLWDVAYLNGQGTAQELVTVPEEHVMALPDSATYDQGASLGIPALTAALALASKFPPGRPLAPGALAGQVILVTGGAGAVGHAAIQLGRWAGATVIATVSNPHKNELAAKAGASHVIDYRRKDVARAVGAVAPEGVDLIVDVAVSENIDTDLKILAPDGLIVSYALHDDPTVSVQIRPALTANLRLRFLLTYTVSTVEKRAALDAVQAALNAGALGIGEDHGLPISRYPLSRTTDAHAAVRAGAIGKVLIDVPTRTPPPVAP
nr:NADPH:quinone reductase [Nocardia otitidiscaviarum]